MTPGGKPRVLFVSPVSDFKGGAEVVLRTMLANPHVHAVLAVPEEGDLAVAARGLGVPVCTYHPAAMLRVHRPPRMVPILAAAADALRCAFRLRRLAVRHQCDIVHSNGLKTHMLCAILGTLTRTRTLVHLHDIPYRRSERLVWRLIVRQVARVIMVSRPCYPWDDLPGHVEVVANGIDMGGRSLPPPRAPGPLRLGFVGRFHPNKGLDLLLDWFAVVRRDGPEATLTIRGRPDPEKPEYWEAVQARIRGDGLAPFVRDDGWVTGEATYDGLDVLLMTSVTPDPAPLVVLEAMRAGLIVAGYPAGGVTFMVEDEVTGLLVRDGGELSVRLRALLDEPARLERMRRSAFASVAERFGIDRFHLRLLDVYRSMLPGGVAPSGPAARPSAASDDA